MYPALPNSLSAHQVILLISLLLPLVGSSPVEHIDRRQTPASTFNNGAPRRLGEIKEAVGSNFCDGIYGVKNDGDLPFARANRGKILLFRTGESNTPDGLSDKWVDEGGIDDPKQSACGIPHNAYFISHVAIHPYWLRYASLDRLCMPDVCISFFSTDWKTDMMVKVTDICSTEDCKSPGDIKLDRTKVKIWSGAGNDKRPAEQIPGLDGDSFAQETIWFFRPCWDDGILQPAYDHDANWFAKPKYYNNQEQSASYSIAQWFVNQARYPAELRHNQCQYNTTCQGDPIPDPDASIPEWEPLCGGLGSSGKHTTPGTRCPTYSGRSGTTDISNWLQEAKQCDAVGDAAAGGPQGTYPIGSPPAVGGSASGNDTNGTVPVLGGNPYEPVVIKA